MTTSAYPELTEVEQLFKEFVWDPLLILGETALETYVPALALPVIKQVDEEILSLISDALYRQIILFVDITSIKLVNALHQSALDEAMSKLKTLSLEKGNKSPEYLKELEDAKTKFANFVRYGATT